MPEDTPTPEASPAPETLSEQFTPAEIEVLLRSLGEILVRTYVDMSEHWSQRQIEVADKLEHIVMAEN